MFRNEIVRKFAEVTIVWYPDEKICLIFKKKSTRVYVHIPKKYSILFEDKV